ncbi:MAG: amidohydrolase family protein [Rhodospirillales bacterium]|nr:amidohydrolase family protein [Rhodospirillales bacterium]
MPFRALGAFAAALSLSLPLLAGGGPAARAGDGAALIDTHVHAMRSARRSANVPAMLRTMDSYRVELSILLPPPFPPGHPGAYGLRELEPIARAHPDRFAFVAGGESLNPMIHRTPPGEVTPGIAAEFRREAEAIARSGAAGFGELAAEHFSSGRGNHPYESTAPDHPLLLVLADIAAEHGMPIDLHMEAVPRDMPFPEHLAGGRNPETVKENISGLERLLAHNRNARIIWAHAGWDQTGERTVPLMRALLSRHSNLHMSVKLDPRGPQKTSALTPSGAIRPGWLALLREFPDRFMVGSDQFHDEGEKRLARARAFADALPADLAGRIVRENALRVYRLKKPAK